MTAPLSYGTRMALASALALAAAGPADAADGACQGLPTQAQLKAALTAAVSAETSGLNNHMWATIVNRDGVVCAVAFSGTDRSSQWPSSRVISAQKASTANAVCLDKGSLSNGSGQQAGLALSTANLYSATQPGGSLYGLQHSNPVDAAAAYKGPYAAYGAANDPHGGRPDRGRQRVRRRPGRCTTRRRRSWAASASAATPRAPTTTSPGASGTSSSLDNLSGVGGVSGDATRPDNIVLDITANPAGGVGHSAGGFGHPSCLNTAGSAALPVVR